MQKLERAKANNETLKVSYTTVLFSGSSGVGKTSLLNKLNKEKLNKNHHSTGVAKSKHAICAKTTVVIESHEGLQWIDLDYDSMISHLNKYLRNSRFLPLKTIVSSLPEENTQSDKDKKTAPLTQTNISSNTARLENGIIINKEVEVDIAKADSSNAPSLGEVWDIINFLDTGGQPEFINILPAVSSSVSLTFIVFNLSKNLDSLVHVQHDIEGDPSFIPYYLDCTNIQLIERLMVSSENFNKNIMPLLKLDSIQRQNGENNSKICYIGTHALKVNEKEIQEIDSRLSSLANEFDLHQRSFWSSPIQQLNRLFPIDLFPTNEEKESFEDIIEDIRDNIQKQVHRQEFYEVPIVWFIFLLNLQKFCQVKEISYISYQEAVDMWMDMNVSKNELETEGQHENVSRDKSDVHNILLFFHFMGMLFYYHEVEGIRDLIFVDCQWLFEKLTELVEIKFTKGYNKKDISAEDVEKFTMEGKLNINIIKNLKLNLQGIQILHFINLLDHLNIIAPINSELKEYFMPCILPSFPVTQSSERICGLDKFYGKVTKHPLLVGLKNGPLPHGFFCHLIVELFRNLPKGWDPPLLSTPRMQHVYNNLITFPTTSGHAISLFYKVGYLEVQVRHKKSQHTIIHYDVKCAVNKALLKVFDHLKLNKEQLCYGFYCTCENVQHFAKVIKLTSSTEYIRCGYGYTELTEDHKVWLQV